MKYNFSPNNFFQNNFILSKNIFYNKNEIQSKNAIKYNLSGKVVLNKRSKVNFTNSFFDFVSVENILKKKIKSNFNGLVLDLGCGDGRFSSWFLNNTKANVVAVDCNAISLKDLLKREKKNLIKKRLILIKSDINNLNFQKKKFDTIFSYEVMYYLEKKKYFINLRKILKSLRTNGNLIIGERTIFGGIIHSLINLSINDFIKTIEQNLIVDNFSGNKIKTNVMQEEKIIRFLNKEKKYSVQTYYISIIPMLISFIISNVKSNKFILNLKLNKKKFLKILNNYKFNKHNSRICIIWLKKRRQISS